MVELLTSRIAIQSRIRSVIKSKLTLFFLILAVASAALFIVVKRLTPETVASNFTAGPTTATQIEPVSVETGDLDGVNGDDMVTANQGSDNVSVFLKNGNTTFDTRADYNLSAFVSDVCLGDFDGINGLDLAVAVNRNTVDILLNNGSGVFGSPVSYSGASTYTSSTTDSLHIACGDINGDGDIDVVMGHHAGATLSVIPGNGDGTLGTAVAYFAGGHPDYQVNNPGYMIGPSEVAITDFDGDGANDIITANGQARTVSVLRNVSNTSFAAQVVAVLGTSSIYNYSGGPSTLAIADLTGDGKPEVISEFDVSGSGSYTDSVKYVTNTSTSGSVGFGTVGTLYTNNNISVRALTTYDFDGDSDYDIAVALSNNTMLHLRSSGGLSYASAGAVATGTGPGDIAAADMDNDGDIDLITANYTSDNTSILYNDTVPVLTTISPTFAVKGDTPVITANGSNFTANDVSSIRFEGVDLAATNFVSITQLTGQLSALNTATVGSYDITVFNGAPGGGESAPSTLEVIPAVYFDLPATSSGDEGTETVANFTINLSDAILQDVIVNFSLSGTASNGTDFNYAGGYTATILQGQTSVVLPITLTDDIIDEVDETIIVTLDSVVGTDAGVLTSQNSHTFTILDDDPPPTLTFQQSSSSGSEGSNFSDYVLLSEVSGKTITVDYSFADITATAGTDYTATTTQLVFSPGVQSMPLEVPLIRDLVADPDETFTVTLDSADWAVVGTPNVATVTISDITPPEVSFSFTEPSGVEGGPASLNIYLSQSIAETVEVNYSVSDISATEGVDYTATGTFTIPAYTQYHYPTIDLAADAAFEGNETFTVTLTSSDLATVASPSVSTMTIIDDHPTIYADAQYVYENNAPSSQTQAVTVYLNQVYSGEDITVHVEQTGGSAVSGTDYVAFTGQDVTILANATTATFNVTTINNSTYDAARDIQFTLSDCNCYLSASTFTVEIIDNNPEIYGYTGQSLNENNSPQTQQLAVQLGQSFADDISVDIDVTGGTAVSGTDFVAFGGPITVTIPAGSWVGYFDVTTINDAVYNEALTMEFTLSNCVNCNIITPIFTATIVDNNESATFSAPSAQVVEGATDSSSSTVYLNTAAAVSETVNFHIDATSTATYTDDYTITSNGTVSFNSGTMTGTITYASSESYNTIEIVSVGDSVSDPDETVIIVLDSYSAGQIGMYSEFTYTIKDPEASVGSTSSSGNESSSASVVINLNKYFEQTTIVNFHMVNVGTTTYGAGGDYTIQSSYNVSYDSNTNTGTVTIDPYGTTNYVYFNINNDAVAEPDESFQLVLDSFMDASNTVTMGGISPGSGTFTYTIVNDDANRIGFAAASSSGNEATAGIYSIVIQQDLADASQNTTFDLALSGTSVAGVDYTIEAGPYSITQNTLSSSYDLTILDDGVHEKNETVIVTITSISGNVAAGSVTFTYTIVNDDSAYAKIFLDSGHTIEADTGANKIPTGDVIYFEVNDGRFNDSQGGVDTISSSIASAVSTGGDTEGVTLTETGADTNIFTGSIATGAGSPAGDGTLQISASDTVTLVLNANAESTIDNFSTYSSTSTNPGALTSISNGLDGYWFGAFAASGSPSLQNNAGDQYLSATSTANNMYVARSKSTAAAAGYSFTESNLGFDISISDSNYSTASWTLGAATFTGLNVLLMDNLGCHYYQTVTDPVGTTLTTISIERASFVQSATSAACSFNFDDVRSTLFIVPATVVNTVTIDNLNQNTAVNYSSSNAGVIGGASPVTLNAAANITSSSMDLSWSQNTDVDFASYKIYYATHATVTTSDSLAATITNAATTTYALTGLSATTQYYIRVLVTNTNEVTAFSNEISATTTEILTGCLADGNVCIMNSGYSSELSTSYAGDTLYIQVSDGDFDTTGSADTMQVEIASTGGDTETVTLTETGATSNLFRGSIVTSGDAVSIGDSTLQVSAQNVITATVTPATSPVLIDDATSCASFSAFNGNTYDCVGGTLNIQQADDLQGIMFLRSGAIDFGTSGLSFDINASAAPSGSYDANGPVFTVPSVVLYDGTNFGVAEFGNQLTSFNQNITINIEQADFIPFGGPNLPNFSAITAMYLIYPSTGGLSLVMDDFYTYPVSAPGYDSNTVTVLPAPTAANVAIMDCDFNSNLATIQIGDTLCFQVEDSTFDTTGAADTMTVTVTSSGGDTELRTLTETAAHSQVFRSGVTAGTALTAAMETSATDSSGVLLVAGGNTIVASVAVYGDATVFETASNCTTFFTPNGNVLDCTSGSLVATRGADPNGIAVARGSTVNFGTSGLSFDLNVTLPPSGSINLGGPIISVPSIAVGDGVNVGVVEIADQITAYGQNLNIKLSQSDFSGFGGGPMPDFSAVTFIYIIYPQDSVEAFSLTWDNLALLEISGYDSNTVTVSGGISGTIDVSAYVDAAIYFNISSQFCNLGTLTSSTVKTCSFNITASTNAPQGYTVYIRDTNNGALAGSAGNIAPAAGSSVSAGTAGFGIGTSQAGQSIVQNSSCTNGSSAQVQALSTANQSIASVSQPSAGDTVTICAAAAISDITPAGNYSNEVVITIVGNF